MSLPTIDKPIRNIAGTCELLVVDVADVVSVGEAIEDNITEAVELAPGAEWTTIRLAPPGSRLTETWRQVNGRPVYDCLISGFAAKDELAKLPKLRAGGRQRYLVLWKGLDGDVLLLGTKDRGAMFGVSLRDRGDEAQPVNGYDIQFSRSAAEPVPFYLAAVPLAGGAPAPELPVDPETVGRVRVAPTANIDLASAPATIDGVTLVDEDRVLVHDQTDPAENGVYVWNGVGVPMTRALDYAAFDNLANGLVLVDQGTANADTMWYCTSNAGGTLNTTAVTYIQFGGSGANVFTDLGDVPTSYAGQALKVVRVNAGETGLEFAAVGGGVTDHGALTGLADDDHPQYHNDARGNALYSPLGHTHPQSEITGLVTDLSNKQPLDSDLTAIAGLTPTNDDIVQRKAGVWTNRTVAQYLADLGLGAIYQPLDADLTAIAALATNGLVERTGGGTAAIRTIGTGAAADVPDRAAADLRYAALAHTHPVADVSDMSANARTFNQAANYAAMRTALGLGSAAVENAATTSTADAVVKALGSGKIDTTFLPDSILGQLEYQGGWNGSTNTPAIPAAATGNKGHYYITTVAVAAGHGYANIANVDYQVGDWLVSNGTAWDKVDNTDAVATVFGRLGAVVAANGDYNAGQITNTPAGGIAAVTVQAALNELDGDKAALVHTHPQSEITGLVTDLSNKQPLETTLTQLAAIATTTGVIEQVSPDIFAIRKIGATTSTDILARGDGDGRYALLAHTHVISDITGLVTDLSNKQPLDAELTAIAALATNGLVERTGAGTASIRTIGTAAAADVPDRAAADLRYAALVHATRHQAGGADAIKLDDLAATDDNTDLNVSISAHGLSPKLPNNNQQFMDGVGTYRALVLHGTGAAPSPAGLVDGTIYVQYTP